MVEFEERFSTEKACRDYLAQLRWPDGFSCPRCNSQRYWQKSRNNVFECTSCRHQTSVTVGTLFEGTRKPLRLWFRTMWFITSGKQGVSALNVKRQLGFERYETVWIWLHKLRRAMVRPNRDRLKGNVEVDETFVGGADSGGKRGRGAGKKAIVVIGIEVFEPKGFGRVRIRLIPDASSDSLTSFVRDVVETALRFSLMDGAVTMLCPSMVLPEKKRYYRIVVIPPMFQCLTFIESLHS